MEFLYNVNRINGQPITEIDVLTFRRGMQLRDIARTLTLDYKTVQFS